MIAGLPERARALVAVLLLALGGPALAAPACVDPGGIGGTGAPTRDGGIGGTGGPARDGGLGGTGAPASGVGGTGAPASGIGGTGAPLANSGVGGTGAPAKGVGGTGIVGTITGFASVCVNGLEVHYDPDTPVDVNGRSASIARLATGQLVAIDAVPGPRGLQARRISVVNALEGPLTEISPDRTRARVMGRPVRLAIGTLSQATRTGDLVEVSGLRAPGGEILASRIAPAQGLADSSAAGPLEHGTLGGLPLLGGPAGASATGASLVRGEWTGTALVVRTLRPSATARVVERAERVVIEGLVFEAGNDRLRLSDVELPLPGGEPARPALNLAAGMRIVASASRNAARELRIEQVHAFSPPMPASRERGAPPGQGPRPAPQGDSLKGGSGTRGQEQETRRESAVVPPQAPEAPEASRNRRSGRNGESREPRREQLREVRERRDRIDEPERVERIDRVDEPERVERIDRIDEPERVERIDRVDEPERIERIDRIDEPERVERIDRIDEPERVERSGSNSGSR